MNTEISPADECKIWLDWKSGGNYKHICEYWGISRRHAKRIVRKYNADYKAREEERKDFNEQ